MDFVGLTKRNLPNLLADELDEGEMPLLKQGEGHRQNAPRQAMLRSAAAATSGTAEDMRSHLEAAMPPAAEQAAASEPSPADVNSAPIPPVLADSEFTFDFRGSRWIVVVRVSEDDGHGDWLEVRDAELIRGGAGGRRIEIQVSSRHPFMVRFAQREPEVMQALVRVAASLGISEALLRSVGGDRATAIRRTANELLRDVFSTV